MPEDLLMACDALVAKRGITVNRSEVIRDLIRDALVDEEWDTPGREIVGTLTLVYDHHTNDITDKIDEVQHHHLGQVISAMHVHLDEHNCLEVIALRGDSDSIKEIADSILGIKGVKHGRLTTTTTGAFI
jgi:CopG family nickel-responsive transcriptional regulator